jgi:tartrate dehydrogenase/decarboxylase / D-malate dehydrogenase
MAVQQPYRIAVMPGDGIGKEVLPEGIRVLEAAARRFSIDLRFDWMDFASCDYYIQHGAMLPGNWYEILKETLNNRS